VFFPTLLPLIFLVIRFLSLLATLLKEADGLFLLSLGPFDRRLMFQREGLQGLRLLKVKRNCNVNVLFDSLAEY
jgi:hypothetical protein